MITQKTAWDIWIAYDEIAKGKALIEKMEGEMKNGELVDLRDCFGRRRNLQLYAHRLFDVQPKLALCVIRAHIAEKEAELVAINERARLELSGPSRNDDPPPQPPAVKRTVDHQSDRL